MAPEGSAVTRLSIAVIVLIGASEHAIAQIRSAPVWDGLSLPITIEVAQNVPVKTSERRADGSYGQERGSLYSGTAFRIRSGQRFRMIETLGEGSCRIEFQGSLYDLSSCPWLPGFTDNQADIYRIVEIQSYRR